MIVAYVEFPTLGTPREQMIEKMRATVPKYEGLDGLVRKYYILTEDGKRAGGVYLWKSREQAERWYTADWRQYMKNAWGEDPVLHYLECPIVVDNAK
jgi:hypothetical protein